MVIPKGIKVRRLHKAFLRYHDPENWPVLREALKRMGRADLIGNGKQHLIPAYQPRGKSGRGGTRPAVSHPAHRVCPKPGSGQRGKPGRNAASGSACAAVLRGCDYSSALLAACRAARFNQLYNGFGSMRTPSVEPGRV